MSAAKIEVPNYYIVIAEKLPASGQKHQVNFDSETEARKAYKQMIAFWELHGHAAIKVEGKDKVVSVSSDIVGSVTLIINNKKVAQVKRGVK